MQTGKAKPLVSLLVFLLLIVTGPALLASVTATVDRNTISESDLLTLTVRVRDSARDLQPDFSPIEQDFDIIDMKRGSSTSISYINGMQRSDVHYDYVLTLRAKRLGDLTIPPIRVGRDTTQAIAIRATTLPSSVAQRGNRPVFFDTSVDTDSTYVQGQVLYTVKLFYAESIAGDFPPPPKLENAVIETLEAEKRYEAIVNNRRYYVLEKQYAIFPQKSGKLVIPRESFVGTRGRGGFFATRQRVSAVSRGHEIEVRTFPPGFHGDNWIPAKGLVLEEQWSTQPPVFRVGEPVNRILTLRVTGLASALLPPFPELELDGAKTYADPPEKSEQSGPEGIIATASTTIGIVPVREGKLTLPEIRIPWWNTRTDRAEVAVIPAQTWEVLPAIGSGVVSRESAEMDSPVSPVQPVPASPPSPWWKIATALLALMWLFSTWRWLALRSLLENASGPEQGASPRLQQPDETAAYRELAQACRSGDASTARKALFLWATARFPGIESLRDLAAMDMATRDSGITAALDQLETSLYAPDPNTAWNGQDLLAAVDAIRKTGNREKTGESALLSTLNPV